MAFVNGSDGLWVTPKPRAVMIEQEYPDADDDIYTQTVFVKRANVPLLIHALQAECPDRLAALAPELLAALKECVPYVRSIAFNTDSRTYGEEVTAFADSIDTLVARAAVEAR